MLNGVYGVKHPLYKRSRTLFLEFNLKKKSRLLPWSLPMQATFIQVVWQVRHLGRCRCLKM